MRNALDAGTGTVKDVVEECLARIAERDGELHAFTRVEAECARARAAELDAKRASGAALGALFGVPVALKANLCWKGGIADCSSKLLANYAPPYDATVVRRLLDADAVIVGTTNMDEFAMGSSTENSAHGPTSNPWDTERTPGGSSGGSAVAVAGGMVPIALGSDTGGSVRQPAALCGVHGLKPTYGRVSRYGLIAFGSSLDAVSPFARTIRDVARVLEVISGACDRDSTCLPLPPFEAPQPADPSRLAGFRVGVPKQCFPAELDAGVRACVESALQQLERIGCELVPIELPHAELAIPTYYVVATAEASSNLARYDGVGFGVRAGSELGLQEMFAATREAGFGEEVKRRILLGTYVLSAGYQDEWYGRAQHARTKILGDYLQAFEEVDLVAGPTSPCTAFRLGEKTADPIAMYQTDLLTVPASLAGLPAISVPCGTSAGLPVGLQLVAPAQEDGRLLRAAQAFELATDHHRALPPMLLGAQA
ncbi:MAG: Asp-tRNA(Asn)/Glu-tRNA(Gln) amidotransferase subunit GatA [Planctomycetes bacterium]|nr:Asp-tRNA(Asn)/Glu-tRNA(Gln) amidotransferase subunit GatA [Planctomycetota bacterium]MCB9905370.1 Asp-tRNA(Asn)/Glu-tRNA(Gln) amidotransferase subunit GatA [Planctomycetota bacterium]